MMIVNDYQASAIQKFLDRETQKHHCVICEGEANEFRDELSKREYTISGLCQHCQDEGFEEEV